MFGFYEESLSWQRELSPLLRNFPNARNVSKHYMRYDNTERLGVIETDSIVTKKLKWIFREQSVADVGVDAIIEQVENGMPMGKFIALQIKSGEGNFHIGEKKITYYASGIHYNYWLNLNVPLILIAHLPSAEQTYWIQINSKNFSKTKKQWKLEIPKTNIFDERAKNKLKQLFSSKDDKSPIFDLYRGKIDEDNLYDFVESISCISEAIISLNYISSFLTEQTISIKEFTKRLIEYANLGMSDNDAEVLACIKSTGRIMNVTSKRMENEIEIFSKLYSEGIYASEYLLLTLHSIDNESQEVKDNLIALTPIPETISESLNSILYMRETVANLSGNYPVLKEAKQQYIETVDILISDFTDAKLMTENLIQKLI